jgi:hypothetical protein
MICGSINFDLPPFLIGAALAAFDLTCFFAMLSSVVSARPEPRGLVP